MDQSWVERRGSNSITGDNSPWRVGEEYLRGKVDDKEGSSFLLFLGNGYCHWWWWWCRCLSTQTTSHQKDVKGDKSHVTKHVYQDGSDDFGINDDNWDKEYMLILTRLVNQNSWSCYGCRFHVWWERKARIRINKRRKAICRLCSGPAALLFTRSLSLIDNQSNTYLMVKRNLLVP